MLSFSRLRSKRPAPPRRTRRLSPQTLETRRVLAGAVDFCLPAADFESPEVPADAHGGSGQASGLGSYTGEGALELDSDLVVLEGAVTGAFSGTFVFTVANGDQLATIHGEGEDGVLTGTLSADGTTVLDVKFDAFFSPDPANSTARFADVVGGGWRMIAEADSVPLQGDSAGYTGSFDYTWSGTGTLAYAKKSK